MAKSERVSTRTGGVMSATKHTLLSWRRDLNLLLIDLFRGANVSKKVPTCDGKKPNTPAITKQEPKNLQITNSRLGPSLQVKGEIFGNEDLLIDGSVEGVIRLTERKLTIGRAASVKADITAAEVVIRGNLQGNVHAKGRIEIGNDGSVTGDLTTPEVLIEDGALFKGSIEIEKSPETIHEDALPEVNPAPVIAAAATTANSV